MITTQKITYDDFILLNDHLSFHSGGLIATFNLISNTPKINKEHVILDFGCGNGITLSFLQRLGFKNLIGYDRNPGVIESSRNKRNGIDFYDDIKALIEATPNVYLLLLESVFSFNNEDELAELLDVIHKLIKNTALKYIGIVDLFSIKILPLDYNEKLISTFGIKKMRTLQELWHILNTITNTSKVIYFNKHIFLSNLEDKYKSDEQANKLMKNEMLARKFESEQTAEIFFAEYIKNMISSYKFFSDYFKYFECIMAV